MGQKTCLTFHKRPDIVPVMKLKLHHVKNVDLMYGQGTGTGYWDEPIDPPEQTIDVPDFKAARNAFQEWRDRNNLGGGNIGNCVLSEDNGTPIGDFSFNGRLWQDRELRTEIEIP